jgi:sarcosine oxidase
VAHERAERVDAIVLGVGAMGSATAAFLARYGQRVLALEQFQLNHALGSSHGRSRILRTAYSEGAEYVRLAERARALWLDLEREVGVELLRPTGGLLIGPPDGRTVGGALRSARAFVLPHELLDPPQVAERYPAFRLLPGEKAFFDPSAATLFPERCLESWVKVGRGLGAEFHIGERVVGWSADARTVTVRTDGATYRAATLVICAGPYLPTIVPGLDLPLALERQVMFWYGPRPERAAVFRPDAMPVFLWERGLGRGYYYGVPDFGDGVKVAGHGGTPLDTMDRVERGVTPDDRAGVEPFAREALDGLGDVRDAVTCVYTNTPDGHFLLDRHPRHANVFLVSPCSGHGFKFSSAIGEAVAQWIVRGRPALDLAPFALARRLSARPPAPPTPPG